MSKPTVAGHDTHIPLNHPFITGREAEYVAECLAHGHTHGDGPFTRRCQSLLEELLGSERILLTTSCTSALEMSAMLCDFDPANPQIFRSLRAKASEVPVIALCDDIAHGNL